VPDAFEAVVGDEQGGPAMRFRISAGLR
jgi:hypothetical protein